MTKMPCQMPAHNKQELPTLEEFELLLEDKAFVDHFNVFLSLPVWGQQVVYNFQDKEFEFEPPIRRRRYFVHRRAIVTWLRQERLPYFQQTRLYVEYVLCCRLRDVGFYVQNVFGKDQAETPETTRVFTANLLSHVVGMQLFRESLRNTSGERVFNCWQDIELFRRTSDPSVRKSQYHHIKTQYLMSSGPNQLIGKIKCLFQHGKLNFEIVPDNLLELEETLSKMSYVDCSFSPDSEAALTTLQGLLLDALRKYWVPRHVLHVLGTTSIQLLQPLFRLGEGEDMRFDEVERLVRCRRLFPRLTVTDVDNFSSFTEVYTSYTKKDDPRRSPSPPESPPKEPGPADLLALWGGGGSIKPVEEVATMDTMSRPWSAVSWAYNEDSIITETPDSPGVEWTEESPSPDGDDNLRTPSGSSISNMLNRNSSIQLPDSSLSRMILSSIERQRLGSMPLLLKDYILGRRDCKANAPRVSQRILLALASDQLACWPFMEFLKHKCLHLDINYFNFWLDVRTYLRLDDTRVDKHGISSRRLMARTLAERYLLSAEEDESIFTEGLKMALLDTLSRGDDESLLFAAHDIVSSTLNISWRKFVGIDRRKFARAACGKRLMNYINSLQSPLPRAPQPPGEQTEPVYFQEARPRLNSARNSDCSSDTGSLPLPCGCGMQKPLGEVHRTIAFEHGIILSEQNVSLLPSTRTMADVVNCSTSSFGSLDPCEGHVVRQEHLRRLVFPEKIDIVNIEVSRKVIIPKIVIPKDFPGQFGAPKGARLILRRHGVMINMPSKPRSFMEVLVDPKQQEFFKRFLLARKVTAPLQFWKAVEDLKDTPGYKSRNMKTNHIFRRFFGKQAKHGANLECNDDVIRQIPFMESITPGMMVCAQASIYRMMERKWYPGYLETFPPESEIRPVSPTASLFNMPQLDETFNEPMVKEWVPRRKMQKRKTFHLWHHFISLVTGFIRSMKTKTEAELFDIYLKRELDRMEPSEKLMETRDVGRGRDSISYDGNLSTQTRVVVRNKVVVVNKLPRDLQFWLEVDRYKQQVDGIAKSGGFDKRDAELLREKAQAIAACFLTSEVPPRVQINIPSEMASIISNNVNMLALHRGIFHDACILIFPVLYHFWKKFSTEWLVFEDPKALLHRINDISGDSITDIPHSDSKIPDFTQATVKDIKTFLVPGADEDIFRINFTLMNGIRLLLPKPKGNWKIEKGDDESIFGEISGSPRKGLGRFSVTSLGSARSGKNLHTSLSKRLSNTGELSSATTGNSKGRSSGGRELSALTPGEQTRNKARRLSALVENLNIRRDESGSPQSRGASRAMRNIHDVIRMAQAFGPQDEDNSVF